MHAIYQLRFQLILIILTVVECMPVKVSTDSRNGFYINSYKTYKYNVNYFRQNDTIPKFIQNLDYFKDILNVHLASCGLNRSDDAELLINVGIVFEEAKPTKIGEPGYGVRHIGDIKADRDREDYINNYSMGVITVDIVDIKDNELVFQGTAIGIVSKNDRKTQEKIRNVATTMFLDMSKK